MPTGLTISPTLDVDLAGLCEAAVPWLAWLPVADQRIQATPDARTVRYYQSAGILDRPIRYEGRSARYGRRHLMQLLVVRLLQTEGLSLAQVQAAMAGATDSELALKLQAGLNKSPSSAAAPVVPIPRSAPMATPALTAVELSPGVVVTVDSRIQSDAARLIERLRRALQGEDI